tara:strand:- start:491 stop:739 length:249 start_codon:yes stop_codon:yes gene_type:complete
MEGRLMGKIRDEIQAQVQAAKDPKESKRQQIEELLGYIDIKTEAIAAANKAIGHYEDRIAALEKEIEAPAPKKEPKKEANDG